MASPNYISSSQFFSLRLNGLKSYNLSLNSPLVSKDQEHGGLVHPDKMLALF